MPYLLGLRGEIQPAYYIFPEGIPPTMSQPSFSVFNFSFKKKKLLPQKWMEPNVSPCVSAEPLGSELYSWSTSMISAQDLVKVESKWANLIFRNKYFSSKEMAGSEIYPL